MSEPEHVLTPIASTSWPAEIEEMIHVARIGPGSHRLTGSVTVPADHGR